ncbi:1-hydroxycarotenoid 3,4-desaturase CrtD [Parvicella tangerina]|uniref:1-hydroxycarotenoid 3,4-desaturase n=1 Tax=Parvicella tangerina TaxID=2829795 RepID=A0A916NJT8_9FLAO|nr:1-hydroxycarotenoid 3,4-desaturase CrtD [Parvicella tangerina]CAG5086524.1 1-hydroxycarotenoid 3,4-desaturase [Parvicella tangerina]
MPKKAIVIGSGIAGIAASIRLAVKGYDVSVFEKNGYPGGKLSEIRCGDYRFDAGPSLFTMPQYVEELFALAGRKPEAYFTYERLEKVCHYFWNDGTSFVADAKPNQFAKDAAFHFNCTKEQIIAKLEQAKFIEETTGKLFLEQSLNDWRGFLNLATAKAIFRTPKLGLNKTLHEVNQRSFDDPKLVQLFDRYATYNGSSPFQTPGIMEVIPHYEFNVGAFFPKKGMVSITNSLLKLAEDLGVRFTYNTPVLEILHDGNIISGVRIQDDGVVHADVVYSNMDVYFTYHKLLKGIQVPQKKLEQERSSSALIFYWGINKQFEQMGVHNIFFADDYRGEFEAIFDKKQLFDDPTIYIHISSKVKKDDAPENGENWFVMINTPPKGTINWEEYIENSKKNIIRKLSVALGEDIDGLITCEEKLFPETIESKTLSYQGSLYGTSSNSKYAAFLRHPNFHKKLKGLYFVGGSAHPGGGIPLCLLSAKIATNHAPAVS